MINRLDVINEHMHEPVYILCIIKNFLWYAKLNIRHLTPLSQYLIGLSRILYLKHQVTKQGHKITWINHTDDFSCLLPYPSCDEHDRGFNGKGKFKKKKKTVVLLLVHLSALRLTGKAR